MLVRRQKISQTRKIDKFYDVLSRVKIRSNDEKTVKCGKLINSMMYYLESKPKAMTKTV